VWDAINCRKKVKIGKDAAPEELGRLKKKNNWGKKYRESY